MEYAFLDHPDEASLGEIIALYQHAGWWSADIDNVQLLHRLVLGSHCFLVAREHGTLIGMGRAISDRASDAYLQDITVRQDRRGQGIGREIVRRLLQRLHDDGIGWVALIADGGATALYRKEGFTNMEHATPMWHQDGMHATKARHDRGL